MKHLEEPLDSGNLNRYLKEVANIQPLSAEEEKVLGKAIQEGDNQALKRMVEANLRFVISISKKYRGLGMSFLDLMNEGNIGLIEAARRFDPEKNVKFITYAVWWIRQAIIHALARQGGAFRLPQKQVNLIYQLGKKFNSLYQKLQREPNASELAVEMQLTTEEVENLMQLSGGNISLTEHHDDAGDFEILDKLVQETELGADEQLLQEAFENQVKDLLADLDDKESQILTMRYGIDGKDPMTLKEIGDTMNLSRERIRQIENLALRKLRKVSSIQELRGFLR